MGNMPITAVGGHIIIESEEDIIFRAGGVEHARIDSAGNFSGFVAGAPPTVPNPDLVATFAQPGALTTGLGVSRFRFPAAATILSVVVSVGTAPTGQVIICDLNKNGTTVFTAQGNRPQVPTSQTVSNVATPDVTGMAAGDYLTVDIDQVGSGTAGSDLTLQVLYKFT